MFRKIYTLIAISISVVISLFNQFTFAQPELQAFLKLSQNDRVVDAFDRNDPNLIFWHPDSIVSGLKFKLLTFFFFQLKYLLTKIRLMSLKPIK